MPPISRPAMTSSKRPSRSASTISMCCPFISARTYSATSARRHLAGVRALVALDDAAAVGEEVRDDVRLVEPGVLGLHVEDLLVELDVVVEADLRAPEARALHLGFELAPSSRR